MKKLRQPEFRERLLNSFILKATSYDEMTNLPKDLREDLKEKYPLTVLEEVDSLHSQEDSTVKYLLNYMMVILLSQYL